MSSTVEPAFFEKVDEIDQQLSAHGAREASRMPAGVRASSARKHADIASWHCFVTLKRKTVSFILTNMSEKHMKIIF